MVVAFILFFQVWLVKFAEPSNRVPSLEPFLEGLLVRPVRILRWASGSFFTVVTAYLSSLLQACGPTMRWTRASSATALFIDLIIDSAFYPNDPQAKLVSSV